MSQALLTSCLLPHLVVTALVMDHAMVASLLTLDIQMALTVMIRLRDLKFVTAQKDTGLPTARVLLEAREAREPRAATRLETMITAMTLSRHPAPVLRDLLKVSRLRSLAQESRLYLLASGSLSVRWLLS